MNQSTKKSSRERIISAILFALSVGLFFTLFSAGIAQAQDSYDLTKEIKVQGAIEKIVSSNDAIGSHILIQTSQGVVDAHLGAGGASSADSLGLSAGEQVTVIGMMQTVGGSNLLIARILTAGNRTTILRNTHGFPVRNLSKSSAGGSVLKGGL